MAHLLNAMCVLSGYALKFFYFSIEDFNQRTPACLKSAWKQGSAKVVMLKDANMISLKVNGNTHVGVTGQDTVEIVVNAQQKVNGCVKVAKKENPFQISQCGLLNTERKETAQQYVTNADNHKKQ